MTSKENGYAGSVCTKPDPEEMGPEPEPAEIAAKTLNSGVMLNDLFLLNPVLHKNKWCRAAILKACMHEGLSSKELTLTDCLIYLYCKLSYSKMVVNAHEYLDQLLETLSRHLGPVLLT